MYLKSIIVRQKGWGVRVGRSLLRAIVSPMVGTKGRGERRKTYLCALKISVGSRLWVGKGTRRKERTHIKRARK